MINEQGQLLAEFRSAQPAERERSSADEAFLPEKRWDFRLPSLRGRAPLVPPLSKAAREERAEEKQRQRQLISAEAAKQAFFQTPAGRARLAYKRGHHLFQYELELNGLGPTIIPGLVGSPAIETTDPVDILNSVSVEGWKLVTGKFIHPEMRYGAVGFYLFKRSQKRRLAMNNPWQDPGIVS